MINLNNLSGIGSKTIAAIEDKIGKDQLNLFFSELKELRFKRLFSLGLDQRIEQEIIKHCFERKYNFSYSKDILRNSKVKKMFQDMLSLIRRQFVFDSNKRNLISYSPCSHLPEIARRQDATLRAVSFSSNYSTNQIDSMKKLLHLKITSIPLKEEIVVLCDEESLYLTLKEKLPKEVLLVCLHAKEEFEQYKEYDLIRFVYTDESKFICDVEETNNVIGIPWRGQLYDVIPELLRNEFTCQKQMLDSTLTLIEEYNVAADPIEREILESVLESLEKEQSHVQLVSRKDLEAFRKKAEQFVEEELGKQQISGVELLKLLKSPVSDHLFLRKVVETVQSKFNEVEETKLLLPYLNFETILPEIDEEKVLEMEQELLLAKAEGKFQRAKDFVTEFLPHKRLLYSCEQFLERVDFLLGIGQFFSHCSAPRITNHKRFSCMNLQSQFLLSKVKKEDEVQAITYYLDQGQTILTGANSGGKTSLLQLMCETQLLAQMGLFVRGVCQVPLYENIHFFTKSSGTVGSGAFETTLKDLADIATGHSAQNPEGQENVEESRSLVLLDEIESITEPGAAGTLIAATLDWFKNTGTIDVVLVSHLGEVLHELCPDARIDGIEASSLDDNLQLVVDRNPKIGVLARSTPQLIVAKLALQEKGNAYFAFLKERMSIETTKSIETKKQQLVLGPGSTKIKTIV